jgi:hypothetical protein
MPIANGGIYAVWFPSDTRMKAADVLADLIRVSGITEFLKVAHMAGV